MKSKKDLIEAFGLVREKYSRMTACPLCPQEVHVRNIKNHFLKDHHLRKVTQALVNHLLESDQKLYRAFNNRKRKFTCQFCNENFDRISAWLNHLTKTHKIALLGRVSVIIDLHVAALKAEPETSPDIRRRLHIIESPQESISQ
jgi:hypothetical protein